MLRAFVRDSVIYGAATLVARGLALLLVPFYTRVLAPADYGLVDISTVVVTLVMLTVAFEISQALARFLPEPLTHDERVRFASTALLFAFGAYGTFLALGLVVAVPMGSLIFGATAPSGFIELVIITAAAAGLFNLVQNQLRWQFRPIAFALTSLVFALVSIAVTIYLVLVMGIGVRGVLAGQLAGTVVATVLAGWLARDVYRLTFDRQKLRMMLAFSIPLIPSSVGVLATMYIDRVAIRQLMTFTDVGLFGIGYRLASVVTLVMVGFQAALTPLIYAHYRKDETADELARIFRYFIALAVLMSLALGMFAGELLVLLTTPAYYGGAVVVPLLAPALLLSAMYVFTPGLGIAKRTGLISLVNIGAAVTNTVLNLLLIPILGIAGAALATLVSAALLFGANMILSQRHYPVPHEWVRLAAAAALGVGVYLVSTRIDAGGGPAVVLKMILLFGTVILLVALRLIRPAEISGFLRRRPDGPREKGT